MIPVIQSEVSEWSRRNFGDQKADNPLFGIAEEVGELAHAHLKGNQKIRHAPEKIDELKKDALADIAIYLMDFCARIDTDLTGKWVNDSYFVNKEYPDIVLQDILICTGRLAENYVRGESVSTNAEKLIMYLAKYAFNHDWDFVIILNEVWSKVKQRNWTTKNETK